MKYPTPGPNCTLPPATGHASAMRNLLGHLLTVANQHLGSTTLGIRGEQMSERGVSYLNALSYIVQLLDPATPPVPIESVATARQVLDQLQALWMEMVISETDLAPSQLARQYAQKLLTRDPTATAHYTNECARIFTEPQLALDLLSQTSRFISTPGEAALVARAQAYAMTVIMHHKNLNSVSQSSVNPFAQAIAQLELPLVARPTATTDMIMTASNRGAMESLRSMGELFFDPTANPTRLKLLCHPLLVGPTGSGKSFLIEHVAKDFLKSDYLRLQRGDWLVRGVKSSRPTVWVILDRLLACDRLTVHIDETDKFSLDFSKEWSASVGSDLYSVLDKRFLVNDYLHETTFPESATPTAVSVEAKIRTSLWIAASGTWQNIFADAAKSASLGFSSTCDTGEVTADTIAKSGQIPAELLLRFNSKLIFLQYPSQVETLDLLRSSGIAELAAELDIRITPDDVNWQRGGMRVLQSLATELVMEKRRRAKLRIAQSSVSPLAA